jgi:hypothetical protein
MRRPTAAILFLAASAVMSLHAASVTTQISADEVPVGSIVQLQVRVEGTTNVTLPQDLGVDGLESALTGRGTQISVINGRMTASGTYSYTIRPLREGTFEIPAIEITVDGRKEKTAPQKLVVTAGGTAPPAYLPLPGTAAPTPRTRSSTATPADAQGKRAFARLIIPKKTIYVGEVVPVEVQFFFANAFKPERDPQVAGEGFTAQKLQGQPTHAIETIGDVRYDVYTFKSSITAVKSGEMKTPVASIAGILSVPIDESSGADSFFGAMMGLAENRRVTIESESVPIQVKALPAAGRPADFAGAVGDFTISATARPDKVAAGDPVTLEVVVAGRGNFEAMGDPQLVDAEDWRPYPPTSRFEKSDDVGYGGRKTFEIPMVAQKPQTQTPTAEFSYFDPDKGKYFTLRTKPVPVEAAASQPAATAAAGTPTAAPSATPTPEQEGQWLTRETKRSWLPVWKRPVFWVCNGAAALVLLLLVGGGVLRRRREGPAGQRAALVRERDRLVAGLSRESTPDDAFCTQALDALALQAQLAGRGGAFELVRSLETEGRDVADLRLVLGRADEMKFSGGATAVRLDPAERRRIAQAVKEVCR